MHSLLYSIPVFVCDPRQSRLSHYLRLYLAQTFLYLLFAWVLTYGSSNANWLPSTLDILVNPQPLAQASLPV